MKEELLHFIWKYQLFSSNYLLSAEEEEIEVIHPGFVNHDSGPDFSNAKVRIGDTVWAGNVEIHLNTSYWFAHRHHLDPAYNNVILHVVFTNDLDVSESRMPILEMSRFIDRKILLQYQLMLKSKDWIACERMVMEMERFTKTAWLNRLGIERFEKRHDKILEMLESSQNNWHESFYISLARNFGFYVNSDAFEHLARVTPLKILAKHKDKLFQVEAFLFGQSGLLDGHFADDFPKSLAAEYKFLKHKYGLSSVKAVEWKFARMRPVNFPTIRISQFAQLIYKSESLFSVILDCEKTDQLKQLFFVESSHYWHNHFVFDKKVDRKTRKKIGESSVDNLLINTVAPYLFTYGKQKGLDHFCEKAVSLLESIKPENNTILKHFEALDFRNTSSYDSQALLLLKKDYCDKKKCLDCAIGTKLLR